MSQDLSVNGPRSPVSLKKVLADPEIGGNLKDFNIFVTNDCSIKKDDPDVLYITADECKQQALYFLENIFDKNGGKFPHYTFHHLLYMYGDHDDSVYKKYPDSDTVRLDLLVGKIKDTDPEFIKLKNLFTYGKDDPEFLQVLGSIQLIAGCMRLGVHRVYIEHPETHLHPKRQSRFMSMFLNMKTEYCKDPAPTMYDSETMSLKLKENGTTES